MRDEFVVEDEAAEEAEVVVEEEEEEADKDEEVGGGREAEAGVTERVAAEMGGDMGAKEIGVRRRACE